MNKIKSIFKEIGILFDVLDYDAKLEDLEKDPGEPRCNALLQYAKDIKIPLDEISYGQGTKDECIKIEAIIKKYCYVNCLIYLDYFLY